jgi:hypothetical protein
LSNPDLIFDDLDRVLFRRWIERKHGES